MAEIKTNPDYFNELLDSHSRNTVKLDLYGLKFFYTSVLNKTWHDIPLIKPPKTTRIPDILSIDQVNQLFAATNRLSYKVFFFTIYSMGLRLGEGIKLTVGDIDSANMRVHIRDAKGNKDRLVPRVNPFRMVRQLKERAKISCPVCGAKMEIIKTMIPKPPGSQPVCYA